jgi:hypothetical protein
MKRNSWFLDYEIFCIIVGNTFKYTTMTKRLILGGIESILLLSLVSRLSFAQGVFPPSLQGNPLEGAIDFHVHSAPDESARSIDDIEIAAKAREYKMRAIVLKNHLTMTADRAYIAQKIVPGIEVFGGIVLNKAVGGINPEAVRRMVNFTGQRGKVVWLPTLDAVNHIQFFRENRKGVNLLDENGKPVPELLEVFKIIAENDLILEMGHSSAKEILTLIPVAREMGVKKILVTHAMQDPVRLSLEDMKEVARMGGYMEHAFIGTLMGPQAHQAWMRNWSQVSLSDIARAIKTVGAQYYILSSDLGQAMNPIHPDGLRAFIEGLLKEGITREEIDLMARKNPARLLGLE